MSHKETSWQVNKGGRIFLPVPTSQLARWVSEGRIIEDDLVWRNGFSGWKRVGDIEEIKPLLKGLPELKAAEE